MAVCYRTKGFVFKKRDSFESDRVFSVFTEDFGRVEVLAKAIRKIASKLRGGIEVFSLSEIEFIQGKNQKTLTDAIVIETFKSISNNLEMLYIANKISLAVDSFIKGPVKDKVMLDLTLDVFKKINNTDNSVKNSSLIFYYFLWNMFSILGYAPQVNNCNICGQKVNPYNIYFSNKEGGVVCKKCQSALANSKKINSDALKLLRIILEKDWNIMSKLKISRTSEEIFKDISESYYSYMLADHSFNNI